MAQAAHAAFERLTKREREAMTAKLKGLALNPALGKPLRGTLSGYYRISYGRLRAVVRSDGKNPLLFVVMLGVRTAGKRDDVYERALAALRQAEPSFGNLFRRHLAAYLAEMQASPEESGQ
ncbi:MAG: hypothetical protein KGM44_11640 [bacterium]|nr:hypothetical protein [bacterium]